MSRLLLLPLLLALCSCGTELPGGSVYAGVWSSFSFNGSVDLGSFQVDDRGRANFTQGDTIVSVTIAPDGTVEGSAHTLTVSGSCSLAGHCSSTTVCVGSTSGSGCQDGLGRAWVSFSLCRAASC